jgi:ligand-binding sensor domain-containing protein
MSLSLLKIGTKILGWLIPGGLLLALSLSAAAERLPLKSYTTTDGLAHNIVNKIVRDSRGFLWFCTADGLSRFDGYAFTNYGTDQGLPLSKVNDILETRAGDYWLATAGGLVRFNPKGEPSNHVVNANEASPESPPMFAVVLPEDTDRYARYFTSLFEDNEGHVWCGTFKGLLRLELNAGRFTLAPVDLPMPGEYAEQRYVNDIVEDRYGSLWIATPAGLYRRWPNGDALRYTARDGLPVDFLHDLLVDHEGRLWVSTRTAGFFRLDFDDNHARPSVAFNVTPHEFSQSEWINQLFEASDHTLWAATARGLLKLDSEGDASGRRYRVYTPTNGLSDHNIIAIAEDAGGNLWLGGANGTGVMRLARNGFVTYGEKDRIASVNAIFADRAGGVCFRGFVLNSERPNLENESNFSLRFGRFDGQHLSWFLPDVLQGKVPGWVNEGVTLQGQSGDWWIANPLYHFPFWTTSCGSRARGPSSILARTVFWARARSGAFLQTQLNTSGFQLSSRREMVSRVGIPRAGPCAI